MGLAMATVAVTVANVWAAPGTATITNDHHVWPTQAISVEQRRALVGHMPTQVLFGERVVVVERRGAWTRIARGAGTLLASGPAGSRSTFGCASSGIQRSIGSSSPSFPSSTSSSTATLVIGFVIDAMRKSVSRRIGVLASTSW